MNYIHLVLPRVCLEIRSEKNNEKLGGALILEHKLF